MTGPDEPEHPLDREALAAADDFIAAVHRGDVDPTDPLMQALRAWVAETHHEEEPMDFRSSVEKVAQRGADRGKQGDEREYRVTARARVPLAAAGQSTTVVIRGKGTRKAIERQLESEGYAVEKVQSRKPGGWVWW